MTGPSKPTNPPPAAAPAGTPPQMRPIDWRHTHLWQLQPVRDLLVLAAVFGLVYLGYVLRTVTVPMLLALALAYLFEPLVRIITRRRFLSRPGAAVAVIILAFTVIVVPVSLGAAFAVVKGAAFLSDVAASIRQVQSSVAAPTDEDLRSRIDGRGWRWIRDTIVESESPAPVADDAVGPPDPRAPDAADRPVTTAQRVKSLGQQAMTYIRDNAEQIASAVGQRALGTGATAVSAAVGVVTSIGYLGFTAFLTAFFFYYFVTGWGRVQDFWESLIPERRKGRVFELLGKMDRVIAGFVRGRLTIVGILAVYMTAAYAFIGVPAWYILGPLVGLCFIVPFLHVLGVPAAMLLMSLETESMFFQFQQHWWWIVFAPIGVYLIAQLLDDYVLSPAIQGKNTDMDTPSILFASIAGGALAGVYGLLLAIPAAACIKILLKDVFWPKFQAWGQGLARDFLPLDEGRS